MTSIKNSTWQKIATALVATSHRSMNCRGKTKALTTTPKVASRHDWIKKTIAEINCPKHLNLLRSYGATFAVRRGIQGPDDTLRDFIKRRVGSTNVRSGLGRLGRGGTNPGAAFTLWRDGRI